MKKVIWIILLLGLLLSACGYGGYSKEDCVSARIQFTGLRYGKLDGMEVNLILNNNFAPDTVGDVLQKCIENGWKDY